MKKNKISAAFLLVLGLVSAIGIAQQIVLVRIFSIGQWYHFAFLIVSIAMLGRAFAGSAACLLGERVRSGSAYWFNFLVAGLAPALWFSYEISQRIPFEGVEIAAELHQWLYAGILYLLLAIPFFFVAGIVTLSFINFHKQSGIIYGVNLAGSGLGALLITVAMYFYDPVILVYLLIACGLLGGIIFVFPRRFWSYFCLAVGVLLILQLVLAGPTGIYVSEYKPLSYVLREPGVQKISRTVDPLSRVDLLESPRFRETPGQLSRYPFSKFSPLPEQRGLFFDGSGPEPVHKFDGDTKPFRFLDYVPTAAGFKIAEPDSLLILGAGGGTGIMEGIYRDYEQITAVEASPAVQQILEKELQVFSGGIINYPTVKWVHNVPRRFATGNHQYSHVYRPLSEGAPGAGAGADILNENYALTVEAAGVYLDSLKEDGVLSIPTWIQEPPRNLIRMAATVVRAAEKKGYEQPFDHLAVLRSWNVGVVIFTSQPLKGESLETLTDFAAGRNFDLDYFPGQTPGASPRFVHTGEPAHSRLIFRLKKNPGQLYTEYGYNVRPTTDDQPYFYQFFRFRRLLEIIREFDFQHYPHTEWGLLLVLVALFQSVVGGIILIILPFIKKNVRRAYLRMAGAGLYFGILGLAYMSVEVALIQRMMLILHYPVYSVAVVLASLLIFSGLGSHLSVKFGPPNKRILFAVFGIVIYLAALQPLTGRVLTALAGGPDFLAIPAVLVLIFPLGFCMGVPFPSGLNLVGELKGEGKIAWAWTINGAASVTGAVLGGLIALLWGYTVLFVFGGFLYLSAGVCAKIIWS